MTWVHFPHYCPFVQGIHWLPWWRHQMETFSALLAICAGNSPVPGEFPTQRPATRSFDVFFDLHLIKRLSKHSWGWWFETLSPPLWRHRNDHRIPSTNGQWCRAFMVFLLLARICFRQTAEWTMKLGSPLHLCNVTWCIKFRKIYTNPP